MQPNCCIKIRFGLQPGRKKKERRMEPVLFNSINLSPEILKAIESVNYTQMTEIQASAIPLIMSGEDVIGRSSTGTGKTAAFGIPAVESISDDEANNPQVLVLCPTRELAMQISEEIRKFARYKPRVALATVYGGQSMDIQIKQLKRAKIVIGTPGRIMDHMRRKTLKLSDIKMVVLDEADEMLNMGFYDDIKTILTEAPQQRQTVLFSATMPPAIMEITKEFQKNPKIVAVDKGKRTVNAIEQYYYQVPQSRKIDCLVLLLQLHAPKRAIVFCNTKKMVDELVEHLNDSGFKSIGLHGDMRQNLRTQVMQDYKSGKINILIATDVAARGIDVEDIDAVFNYDIPQEFEYYIHRIGRTGRAGKAGASYTLASNRTQVNKIRDLERFIGAPIKLQPIPSPELIIKKNREKFADKIKKALDEKDYSEWKPFVESFAEQGYELEKIAYTLIGMIAEKDKRLVPAVKAIPREESEAAFASSGGRVWLTVDIGRDQRIAPNFLVGAIVEGTGLPAKAIGKIEIYDQSSNVEMSAEDAQLVLETMQNSKIKNMPVTFSVKAKKTSRQFNQAGAKNTFKDKARSGFKSNKFNDRAQKKESYKKKQH